MGLIYWFWVFDTGFHVLDLESWILISEVWDLALKSQVEGLGVPFHSVIITKFDKKLLRSVTVITKSERKLLQTVTSNTRCNRYYKVWQKVIIKCDRCYKVKQEVIVHLAQFLNSLRILEDEPSKVIHKRCFRNFKEDLLANNLEKLTGKLSLRLTWMMATFLSVNLFWK